MIDRGQIIDCLSAAQLDAKCHRRLRLRTNDVKKVLDILAMRYNIVNVYVNGDEIIVDQPVNSDELAWVLYNERVFVSEYHLEEESLENYFIHRIGVLIMRELLSAEFYKLYKSLGFRVCLIVFFVQDIIYLISVGLVGDILGIELTGIFSSSICWARFLEARCPACCLDLLRRRSSPAITSPGISSVR